MWRWPSGLLGLRRWATAQAARLRRCRSKRVRSARRPPAAAFAASLACMAKKSYSRSCFFSDPAEGASSSTRAAPPSCRPLLPTSNSRLRKMQRAASHRGAPPLSTRTIYLHIRYYCCPAFSRSLLKAIYYAISMRPPHRQESLARLAVECTTFLIPCISRSSQHHQPNRLKKTM